MQRILYFDICAIVIMLILFASIFLHKMTRGRINRSFIYGIICCLLAAIFDVCCEMYGIWLPIREENILPRYIFFYGYFLFRNMTALVYVCYLISLTDSWHKLTESLWLKLTFMVPYIVLLLALLTNPWTNLIFYFNENLNYMRGDGIYILYAVSLCYLIIGFCHLLKYRELFSRNNLLALLSLFPLTASAVLFQFFFPHLLIEVFATVVALMFVILTVQRPEENVHPVLGIANAQAHSFILKRAFFNHKSFDLILIRIKNHSSILTILGPEVLNQFLLTIIHKIQDSCTENKVYASISYLEQGTFAVFIDRKKDMEKSEFLAKQINRMLRKNIMIEQYMLSLLAHVCVVHCPRDIKDAQSLAMFETSFHTMPNPSGKIIQASALIEQTNFHMNAELGSILSRGLANRNFEVYYQPIYSITEQRFSSAEALVRLKDEVYGFVPPGLFIPAAEKNGTIYQIGEFVFEEVCRFIKSPTFEQLQLSNIEINLSVAQCMQTDLADKLIEIAKKYDVAPEKINLEITETAVEKSREVMLKNLDTLKAAGFRFSLDDYGTGYSNIQRILSLPLEIVKLDKTFADQAEKSDMQIILQNTIRMLRSLNLAIVVEGVETKEQLDLMTQLNCDYIQGYHFSKPLPKDDFITFIQKHLP